MGRPMRSVMSGGFNDLRSLSRKASEERERGNHSDDNDILEQQDREARPAFGMPHYGSILHNLKRDGR